MKSGLKDLPREAPTAALTRHALRGHQGIRPQPAGKSTDLAWSPHSGNPQFRMGMGCGTVDEEGQMQAQQKG